MGIKILHSADWHLDSSFAGFPEGERQFLRQAQREIPEKIASLCRRENCDLVLLAGDLFDGDPAPDTVRRVKRALADCVVPVMIAPGNHDHFAACSPWLEEWPENVYIFREPGSVVLKDLDCRVCGAGYESMDCPPLLEGFRAEGRERRCVMVLHGDPVARNSPCCPVTAAQVRESGLDYLALGHIHRAGSFRAGETLCAWPGCPMGRGWDETGEKGVYLVTLGERTDIRMADLGLPRFYAAELDGRDNGRQVLEACLPAAPSADFYRVKLTLRDKKEAETLRARFAHIPHLQLLAEEAEGDLWQDAGEDTLLGVYFSLLKQAAGEDPRAALAAEISRKLLAGREVTLP